MSAWSYDMSTRNKCKVILSRNYVVGEGAFNIYFHEYSGIFGVSDSVCTTGKLENTRYIKNIKGGTIFTFCVCEKT